MRTSGVRGDQTKREGKPRAGKVKKMMKYWAASSYKIAVCRTVNEIVCLRRGAWRLRTCPVQERANCPVPFFLAES